MSYVRQRICSECQKVEEVRKDNRATRCRSCSGRANNVKALATIRARRKTASCRKCSKVFFASENRKFYCGMACWRADTRVDRQCKSCAVHFTVERGKLSGKTNSSGNFCSRPCYNAWLCRTPRVNGRGSRWKTIRSEVIRRAPFCACCGTMKRLEVHHIVPYRITHDNSPSNLIALCKACHKTVETITHDVELAGGPPEDMKFVLNNILRTQQLATLSTLRRIAREVAHAQ